jgi:acetylornithine/N-succinyldiaminopimelate aminotransferase
MNSQEIKEMEKKYIMHNYGRFDLAIEKGKGAYVFDPEGKKYLDFIAGIACVPAGHANKKVISAVTNEIKKLTHVSNLYYTIPRAILAEKLVKISGLSKCFFCNSGAEANEAAIKLAKKVTGKKEFIVCEHAFPGRTHGS